MRAAASDPRALERLVRSAYRHAARYYVEVARNPSVTPAFVDERLALDTPELIAEAVVPGKAVLFVGLHFGSVEMAVIFLAFRVGETVTPMETIDDAGLQAYFERTRGVAGIRLVGLREARRELTHALRNGIPVGLVGDRDLTGGGTLVPLFGAPALMPMGPAMLAVETGVPTYGMTVRRAAEEGHFRGKIIPIDVPAEGTRRERVTTTMTRLAAAFEDLIADAPDQWWAVFFPIWPDLEAEAGADGDGDGRPPTTARAPEGPRHDRRRRRASAVRTCTSTRSPAMARPASPRSSTTSRHGPTSTSSPSPITSGSMRRSRHRRSPATAACAPRSSSARRSPRSAATCWGSISTARSGPTARSGHRSWPCMRPAVWPSRPIRWSHTRSVPKAGCCAASSTTRILPPGPMPSRRSTRPVSASRGIAASSASPMTTAWPMSATATPTHSRRSGPAGRPSPARTAAELRHAIETGSTEHGGTFHETTGQLGTFGHQLRKRGRDARDEVAGRVRRDGTGRDHGYPGRAPPTAALRIRSRARGHGAPMKIGLVCPYIYPERGGVAQHVQHLYENLRLRGHDVRIITASHGPQRASEGDILRIGVGFSVPLNGSIGTLTFSPRYVSQVRELLDRERFDVLHLHEPFVPLLSLFLLRESRSVNIATFHAYAGFSPSYEVGSRVMKDHAARLHGRIAVSAAARHFIDRFFPGDYKIIPNGVDIPRFAGAVPLARWQDGTPNVLFVGRHEPRKGLLDLLKAHRILRRTGYENRLLIVGSGPQEREARRYVATRGLQAVEFLGRVTDAEKAQLFRTADVFASPATGGESFGIVLLEAMAAGAPIVASDIHGYKGVVRRGREGLLVPPHEPKELATAIARLLDDPHLRAEMSAAGRARAEQFSWPRVTAKVDDYYGFVIRRLAATGQLPEDFRSPVPQAPPVRARLSCRRTSPTHRALQALRASRRWSAATPRSNRRPQAGHRQGKQQHRQGRCEERRVRRSG